MPTIIFEDKKTNVTKDDYEEYQRLPETARGAAFARFAATDAGRAHGSFKSKAPEDEEKKLDALPVSSGNPVSSSSRLSSSGSPAIPISQEGRVGSANRITSVLSPGLSNLHVRFHQDASFDQAAVRTKAVELYETEESAFEVALGLALTGVASNIETLRIEDVSTGITKVLNVKAVTKATKSDEVTRKRLVVVFRFEIYQWLERTKATTAMSEKLRATDGERSFCFPGAETLPGYPISLIQKLLAYDKSKGTTLSVTALRNFTASHVGVAVDVALMEDVRQVEESNAVQTSRRRR